MGTGKVNSNLKASQTKLCTILQQMGLLHIPSEMEKGHFDLMMGAHLSPFTIQTLS